MNDAVKVPNPYESPQTVDEPEGRRNRLPGRALTTLTGSAIGAISFVLAIRLIPTDIPNPSAHDLRLANNLGFIYPVAVALWSAWIRRSLRWAFSGTFVGLLIGTAYFALCDYDFFAVMVAFPCLLGGGASMLLGNGRHSWIEEAPE